MDSSRQIDSSKRINGMTPSSIEYLRAQQSQHSNRDIE
jgi:hypothetical protein